MAWPKVVGSADEVAHSPDWLLDIGCQLEAQPELKPGGQFSQWISPRGLLYDLLGFPCSMGADFQDQAFYENQARQSCIVT